MQVNDYSELISFSQKVFFDRMYYRESRLGLLASTAGFFIGVYIAKLFGLFVLDNFSVHQHSSKYLKY